MINSVNKIPIKFLKGNKALVLSCIISIMLSVSLIISMFTFTTNAGKFVKQETVKLYGDMDIMVYYDIGSRKKVDADILTRMAAIPNVKSISKVLIDGLQFNNRNIYSVGVDSDSLSKSRYKYKKDLGENDIIINKSLSEALNVDIGDIIKIYNMDFKLVEIFEYPINNTSIPDIFIINRGTFKKFLNNGVEASTVLIKSKDKSYNTQITKELKSIDRDLKLDLVEEDEFLQKNLKSLNTYNGALGILVLTMSGLLILGIFGTFLYNYRNQFAVIRAIGGTAKQAHDIVLHQCTIINILGVISGVAISYFSNIYLLSFFNILFSMNNQKVDFSFPVAVIIAVLSFIVIEIFMLIPAYKSTKILPLKIVNENEKLDYDNKKVNKLGIVILLIISGLFILYGYTGNNETKIIYGLIGSVMFIFTVYAVFPYYCKDILNLLLPFLKTIGGSISYVALKNLIPQVRKNTIVILSISTMVIIATFGGSSFKTIKGNNDKYYADEYVSDIMLNSSYEFDSNLDHDFKNVIDQLKGVRASCMISHNNDGMFIDDKNTEKHFEYILGDLDEMKNEGLIPKINSGFLNKVIFSKKYAEKYNIKVGDKIQLKEYDGIVVNKNLQKTSSGFEVFEVAALMDKIPGLNIDALIDWRNTSFVNEYTKLYKLLIFTNDKNTVMNELTEVKKEYPEIKFGTLEQVLKETDQMFYQRWSIFIVALFIIMLSVILGVFNSLINNINSRRKEYAILRTLKLGKVDLIRVIITQVLVYIFIGVIMGLILGTFLYTVLILMESGSYFIVDLKMSLAIVTILFLAALIVFLPIALSLSKRKISVELTEYER